MLRSLRDGRRSTAVAAARTNGIPLFEAIGGHTTGLFLVPGVFDLGNPAPGVPVIGTIRVPDVTDYRRNHFFGLTGTYYDKDLTDIVYRYDVSVRAEGWSLYRGRSRDPHGRRHPGPAARGRK